MKYTIGLSGVAGTPNNQDKPLRTAWQRDGTQTADSFSTFSRRKDKELH